MRASSAFLSLPFFPLFCPHQKGASPSALPPPSSPATKALSSASVYPTAFLPEGGRSLLPPGVGGARVAPPVFVPLSLHPPVHRCTFFKSRSHSPSHSRGSAKIAPAPKSAAGHLSRPRQGSPEVAYQRGRGGGGWGEGAGGLPFPYPGWPHCRPRGSRLSSRVHLFP